MKTIADYMSKDFVIIDCDTSLLQAINIMRDKHIGAIMALMNDQEKTLGIFTERDVLNKIDFEDFDKMKSTKIKDMMTTDIITANASDSYTKVLEMMQTNNIRHIPISFSFY